MPVHRSLHPAKLLAAMVAGAVLVSAVLVSSAAPGERPDPASVRDFLMARADSDSVDVGAAAPSDSTKGDSSRVRADSSRALYYLRSFQRDDYSASLFQRKRSPLSPRLGNYWQHELTLDSTTNRYVAREKVAGEDVRYPISLDFDAYRQARLRQGLYKNWNSLADYREQQRLNQRRGGLGVNIVVPGGRQSAFSSIFGAPQVDLRVTGQAFIQAGFDHRKSDMTSSAAIGRTSQLDPTFKQDLSLGIVGTIGDKLQVDVSWDTKNQFDYQNQLKLQYKGYEDEIIQSIEAGNVFLQTPSTLIRGGQSLFGIKSEFQLGGIRLTTVASQQEGQSNSIAIEGGAQQRDFELRPTDYDDNTHFFLGYYFRNRWEDALSRPPNILLGQGFQEIREIEVWKLEQRNNNPGTQNVRHAVAMVDLGEPVEILTMADGFEEEIIPNGRGPGRIDQYTDAFIETALRPGNASPISSLKERGLTDVDFQVGQFRLLERGRDYDVDTRLGYISLRQRLQENEAIAVAYKINTTSGTVQVGDFSTESGGSIGGQTDDKLVLKLLRPAQPQAPSLTGGTSFNPAFWYLEMRNIYNLRTAGINANEFELNVFYEPPGSTPRKTLPGMQRELLNQLGLDRLGPNNSLGEDYQFDYMSGFTIIPSRGLLLFPYLEPFGDRMAQVIDESGVAELQSNKSRYVFDGLYVQKRENAVRDTQHDIYRIRGSYKGAVQAYYDLGAFTGVVPGSVTVTSGGTPLTENVDYTVDYQGGSVTITNPAYLTSGRAINITYEQNQMLNIQKKTLLGAYAEYAPDERFRLGAQVMRLNQKSPVDKFRIGEEPISNTIWGLNGNLDLQPSWLTRAIDALPLLQTKAPSSINITGEFAQLRPGNAQTLAFEQARRKLRDKNRDFTSDELRGVSYLDDFEGFETTYSLKQPGAWILSAAPDSIPVLDDPTVQINADSLRTNWRGLFGWYTLSTNAADDLASIPVYADRTGVKNSVTVTEIFPNRDPLGGADNFISTLDIYFNPRARGPYNYTRDLRGFIDNPKSTWGGMTQRLPEGYNDFTLKNIEFVELIISPYSENPENDAGPDAKLFLDLGSISEDIIPNENLNLEDGIPTDVSSGAPLTDRWSRFATAPQNNLVDINPSTGRTEDLGLDGIASINAANYEDGGGITEQLFFADFLNSIGEGPTGNPYYDAEAARARLDPSGDDYVFYRDKFYEDPTLFPTEIYPQGAYLPERFSRYFAATELNSVLAYSQLNPNGTGRGVAGRPDTEDLNSNSTVDTDNSYFQYEIPLSRAELERLASADEKDDYVVNRISPESGADYPGWYLIRIPVRKWTRKTGTIQDFTLIESVRLWTTGHEVPITIRIASMELVGSQWQKAPEVANDVEKGVILQPSQLSIASVNNEEDEGTYMPPLGAVVTKIRSSFGTDTREGREQALQLDVENLHPGNQQAIYKTFQGENLLKYDNLRMYVHMHGTLGDGITDLAELAETDLEAARSKVRLFVRIGSNQTNDYYEYEQPLTPSKFSNDADELWRTFVSYNGEFRDLNSMNINLSAFNQLRVLRSQLGFAEVHPDSVFWSVLPDGTPREGAPDVSAFAPPGTRIGVKGNPSLARVNTIVIGIRNPADATNGYTDLDVLQKVTVWLNELRASGYDDEGGWASLLNADVQLADLGRVKANFNLQTDGFGDLNSTLGTRDQASINNWGVLANLNLDKFVPERFGWSLPVSFQVQSNTTTPRFSPQNGDILLEDIYNRNDLDPSERDSLRRATLEDAQTRSFNRSFTASIQKSGSESRLLRNTLDGLSINYAYSDAQASNPSQRLNDSWRWTTSVTYRLTMRKPRTVRPFWFLNDAPIIGLLGDLRFNYLPQSISMSGSARRYFSAQQQRGIQEFGDTKHYDARFPIREQHTFDHQRNFSIQYNPFSFLNLTYDSNTDQSLSTLGADKYEQIIAPSEVASDAGTGVPAPGGAAVGDPAVADTISRLRPIPTGQVLSRIFSGHSPRPERYDQRFSLTFQPQLNKLKALNWITLQPITYSAIFGWNNGPVGQIVGASVRSQVEVRGGVSFRPLDFWRKFDFYENIEKAQRAAEQEKRNERNRRIQERQRRREAKRAAEAARQAAQDSLAAASIAGTLDAEDVAEMTDEQRREEMRRQMEEEYRRLGQEPPPPVEQPAQTATAEAPSEDDDASRFSLPMPDPLALLRRTFLAVTGVKDFTVTYRNQRSSAASNVGTLNPSADGVEVHYNMLDALRGQGPSLAYRLGLDRQLRPEDRLFGTENLIIADDLSDNTQFLARTTLTPSPNLNININWNTDWGERQGYTFAGPDSSIVTRNGNNQSSVWAFGASYMKLFKRQRETFDRDDAASAGNPQIHDDGDGRVALSSATVVEDFRSAFITSFGTLDSRQLLPIPMPSWQITYNGISNWPIIRSLVESATLKHGYSADYRTDFETNATPGETGSFRLGQRTIIYPMPDFNVGTVRVNERYQPLIGVDLTFKGRFTTSIDWNKTTVFTLSTSQNSVSEIKTDQISATASYQRQGLSLPFLPGKRLNNRISFSMTVAWDKNSDIQYYLRKALESRITNGDAFKDEDALELPNIQMTAASQRFTISPKIAYQFSNRVSADFTLKREQFISDQGNLPSYTNTSGGFNIRVSISN